MFPRIPITLILGKEQVFLGFLTEMSRTTCIAGEFCVVVLQVTKPENGKDVKLKLAVTSRTSVQLQLSINISVQAMKHNGTAAANIQSEVREDALQPGKGAASSASAALSTARGSRETSSPPMCADLSVPVLVPFLSYATAMLGCGSMKVVALVSSKQERARAYMAQQDVVLADPPISLTVSPRALADSGRGTGLPLAGSFGWGTSARPGFNLRPSRSGPRHPRPPPAGTFGLVTALNIPEHTRSQKPNSVCPVVGVCTCVCR